MPSSPCSTPTSCCDPTRGAGEVAPSWSAARRRWRAGRRRFARLAAFAEPAVVNGAAGVVVATDGRPISVMGFTVVDGRIVEIDVIADPERLARLVPTT